MQLNYLDKIKRLVDSGALPMEYFSVIETRHDDDCPMLKGIRECSCDPEIWIGDHEVKALGD